MGIDSLDVSFRLQKHFDIEIRPDDSIYLWESPRRIIQLVTARLSGEILAIPDFPSLMKSIVAAVESLPDYRRRWFRRDLADGFPRENRERNWQLFGEALGCELPPLQPSESGTAELPRECASYRRLGFWMLDHAEERVHCLPPHAPLPVPDDAGKWNAESIQRGVFEILIDVLGVDEEEVTLDADLVDDLGME